MTPESITHRRILKAALPIILSNATIPILGAVDTGVIGQLGAAAPIGAVGIGAIVLSSLYWLFGFLRMGTTGLVAQAVGAGNKAEASALLMRGLIVGGAAGLALVMLQFPLFWLAFKISPASAEVESLAHSYLSVRIWSAPAAIGIFAITGWLIGQERMRAVLVLQLVMNLSNIGLDIWFVLGLDWGVPGVAFATVLAEILGLTVGLYLCRSAFAGRAWRDRARIFDRLRIARMLVVNGDIMMRSVLLLAALQAFLFTAAGLGDEALAANQVLMQFMNITAYALDGFAFAVEALVGASLGAGALATLRRAVLLCAIWSLIGAVLLALGFWVFGPWLIDVMSTNDGVRAAARNYLPWMVLAPLVGVASWFLDGVFIGATATRAMRIAMLQSTLIYAVALAILVPLWGNHGLWLALMVLFVARAATLARRYPEIELAAASQSLRPLPTASATEA
ncbi:MAG: MATE family efflux transporter [Paracoccaceae bacterium]